MPVERGSLTVSDVLLVAAAVTGYAALGGNYRSAALVGVFALGSIVTARLVPDRWGRGVRPHHLAVWTVLLVGTTAVCVPASRTCTTCSPVPPPGQLTALAARAARAAVPDTPSVDSSPVEWGSSSR